MLDAPTFDPPVLDVTAGTPASSAPKSGRRRTLLIVDDEEGPRQSIRFVFRNDYELLTADCGTAAIDLARGHRIDAAILDFRMPGMTGIEVLQGLRAVDPYIEVIMLTAYETPDSIRQALRLGACDYLNKPFDIPALRTAVTNAMERRSLSLEVRANSEKLRDLQGELEKQRLEEAMARSHGEIYASVVHDLNGPLTVISGFLEIINQQVGDGTEIRGKDLQTVKGRLRGMTKQVSNCIDISRRYLGFLRHHPDEAVHVSVNQCLADVDDLVQVHPAARSHDLVVIPLAEDVMAPINGTDLIQILRNLMVNALQCTGKKHRVEVRGALLDEPSEIDRITDGPEEKLIKSVEFGCSAPLLALTVEDTGPGIPPDDMRKLFSQSFTTREPGKGTGLGLSIVHRLVSRARGAIHVRTKIGRGTCFTVFVPAS